MRGYNTMEEADRRTANTGGHRHLGNGCASSNAFGDSTTAMAKADLYPDFTLFLESLNSAGVRYLLIGDYAVIFYGYRRATDDMDVWVAIDNVNSERVAQMLQSVPGAPSAAEHVPAAGESVHFRARARARGLTDRALRSGL
jgi:hypothetical protein